MTDFRRAWLAADSTDASTPRGLVDGEYDLLVMTSSWDSRCLCLLECEIRADRAVGIFFENRGAGELRDSHDPQVRAFLNRASPQVSELRYGSDALDELWNAIWQETLDARAGTGRALRVMLDLSTCPRYFALALLAAGFRSHLFAELVVFYAEGRYPPPTPEDPHEPFTAGRWETVPVPLLEGRSAPGLPRHYVVSVGFEGSKTLRALSNEGADAITVVFPRPAVAPEYEQRSEQANQILFDEFGVSREELIDAPAGDAIATWRAVDSGHERWHGTETFYLTAGTKPQALGLALDALVDGQASVMYAKPANHKETAIVPLGRYWRYTISDLTTVPVRG